MGCLAGESQSLGGRKLAGGRRSVGKSAAQSWKTWRDSLQQNMCLLLIILQQQALDELHRNLLIRSLDAKDQRLEFDRQSTKDYATYRFIVQRFSNRL
ncbi:hypothetical protein T11_7743 [Trichinella zimbabwensis]|uniref:Uncharacterized protein n=1 Tax=Trichinella zimbabwensis TaxID=268475 RepID=A0A0V1H9Q2_9BILA|nr:hypothetical protein T11_7743 [Trichinella zimbabwensis]